MQSVCMVILAKYYESPPDRDPVGNLSEEGIEQLRFADISAIVPSVFAMDGEYGPVVHNEYTLAGQLSETFIEVLKRSSETRLAEKSWNRLVSVSYIGVRLDD